METERCPICWRNFSAEALPVCLACGHSCCKDCCRNIRACPLCRHKISHTFGKNLNYALIAMVEKATRLQPQQTVSASTQTEAGLQQTHQAQRRPQIQKPPMLEGKTMTVQIKPNGIAMTFK